MKSIIKKLRFNKICKNIKELKIQGAKSVAKNAFFAYKLVPTKDSKKKLLSLRPTEPMLYNVLKIANKLTYKDFLRKLEDNQNKINLQVYKLIKNNSVIFTHCHSSTVTKALIFAKKRGKNFVVYNTETRPLYQGRKTARELKKAGIKLTMFVDSAARVAMKKTKNTKKVDLVLVGADAITDIGVINKIGSGMFAVIAKKNKIPYYVVADSWKYSSKNIKIEERDDDEVWDTKLKINIRNPAFGIIEKKNITGIISELGKLKYSQFLKKVKN